MSDLKKYVFEEKKEVKEYQRVRIVTPGDCAAWFV